MTRLALALFLIGQTAAQVPPKPAAPAAALAAAEAKWKANKPAAYEFTIEVICFCPPPLGQNPQVFRVTNGVPARVGASDPQVARAYDNFDTIEELFAVIKRFTSGYGIRINVKYDAELGFPVAADLDQAENMADDELRFNVTNFKVVTK